MKQNSATGWINIPVVSCLLCHPPVVAKEQPDLRNHCYKLLYYQLQSGGKK